MTWKIWLTAATIAGASVTALSRYGMRRDQRAPQYETVEVEKGAITGRVTASGTLSALVTVQVGSQVSGRILEILVDFNSKVSKGQELARIDPQLFQAALAQARANHAAARGTLAKAKARAANAERKLMRFRTLAEGRFIAEADLDQCEADAAEATAEVEAAKGSVEQARAAMRQAEINLTYTTIASPVDGVVISRNVDVGQTVAASLQAPTLFTIARSLARMQVDTSVSEADVGKLEPGLAATFTVDAYASSLFRGVVREIRNAPQTLQNVVTYDAVIEVDNPELKLKPGMTAKVNFVYAQRDGVLRVPNAALRFRPSDGSGREVRAAEKRRRAATARALDLEAATDQRTIWVLRNDTAERVSVHVGLSDGVSTEIVDGPIAEKDKVILDTAGGNDGAEASPGGRPSSRLF